MRVDWDRTALQTTAWKAIPAVSTQATNPQENPLAGFGPNEWIVEDMYHRYLADPGSVDPAWHEFFADYKPVGDTGADAGQGSAPASAPRLSAALGRLIWCGLPSGASVIS